MGLEIPTSISSANAEERLLFSSKPSASSYLVSFYKKIQNIFTMKPVPIQKPFASKGEFSKPPSKPNHSSSYELHPSLKAMVQAQTFSGHYCENPRHHLLAFKEMCSCLSISGMTQETLRWKLFSFSLTGRAKQWYTDTVESTDGD